ncbi:hypothetical protein AQ1_01109 [alpha proteobacterium Q-1]|nr:hypothetical protein [Iodidimonas nitroreducens]GAK33222.1 hypothetical protein AQ1_01109 [alpha proteobacterium Q-1]
MLAEIAQSPWSDALYMIGDPTVLLWCSTIAFVFAGLSLTMG